MAFYSGYGGGGRAPYRPYTPYGRFSHPWPFDQPMGQRRSAAPPPFTSFQNPTPPMRQPDPNQSPQAGPPPGPPPPDGAGTDPHTVAPNFEDDPILARVRALAQQSISQAEAAALAEKQQLAIGYGDPKFAQSLGLDAQYAKAADANPFSTTKELARTYQRRDTFGINRPLSDYHNLFYSSERGRQLGMSAEQNLRDNASALQAVQARVAAIDQAVAQAKLNAMAQELAAEQQAYQNAWQQGGY